MQEILEDWKKKLMIEHCVPGILEISENEISNLRSKNWKSNYAIVYSELRGREIVQQKIFEGCLSRETF
jgi:hypothetical protein